MLYLSQKDYVKILEHCKNGLPNEACGLIAGIKNGDVKAIKKVYLLTNIEFSFSPGIPIQTIEGRLFCPLILKKTGERQNVLY